MDRDLYKSTQNGNLEDFKHQLDLLSQNNNNFQIHNHFTITNNNLLHVLCQFGDYVGCVLEVLERVNDSQDHERSLLIGKNLLGETALHIASRNGHVNIVQALIEHAQSLDGEYGYDLEVGGATLTTVEKMMIRATDKHGDTALHNAVKNKHREIVRLLVLCDPDFEHPANDIGETPLYVAVERRYHDIVELIMTSCSSPGYKGRGGQTALHAAVLDKCIECTRKLVSKKSTLAKEGDELGRTPLQYLSYIDTDVIEANLRRIILYADKYTAYTATITNTNNHNKAPPQKKETNNNEDHQDDEGNNKDDDKDDHNKNSLHTAACENNIRTMEDILEERPDCWDMVTSKSWNILHLSAMFRSDSTFEYILRQRWAMNLVNQKDVDGNTPFHLLAKYSVSKMLLLLEKHLEKNDEALQVPLLDSNAANKEGHTPMDLLQTNQQVID